MVQHARADDVLECLAEFAGPLDGELPHLEVLQPVLALELFGERDAPRADVDADDARIRPADGVMRRLARAASRDQNAAIVAVGFGGLKQMRLGAAPPVVPRAAVRGDVVHRLRVGVAFVERSYARRDRARFRIFIVSHR